ncbi:uncharacterized protein LOC124910150 [Impatiens glandulifera]|uniref:uncharacterized protein LOC124910150 n=1 Tax=Impatiens glandulifera TaxID=253017 RepID=UPI001FB1254A|nr:uncharacterized protein LOC124910150 [Impatiens glandulifera]
MGDDGPRKLKFYSDHFQVSSSSAAAQTTSSSSSCPNSSNSVSSNSDISTGRKLKTAASMLNFFSVPKLPWSPGSQEKVVLTVSEVECLRSELADLEERTALLKAQLHHLDGILQSARLSGYLYIRTRWAALPGEVAPPLDDLEIDDWLPRFLVLHGQCIFFFLLSTDISPQDSTLLADIIEVGRMSCFTTEDEETRHCFYILTRQGLRYECCSNSKIQVLPILLLFNIVMHMVIQSDFSPSTKKKMSFQFGRSASRAIRSLLSASKQNSRILTESQVAPAAAVLSRGKLLSVASLFKTGSENASRGWISGALALPAAVYMLKEQEANAAEFERTFIAIKPDGVQRGLISEIISRFERKGFKLVAIKIVVPSKAFAGKHYHDLKERPFFNGLCDFLSSGPVVAMVWEGEGVIKYGRKLIGATDPQKSEPGTIRGDLAVVVGRNIIHGSDGPETAKDEIALWFKRDELTNYTSNAEKWIYGVN